MLIWILAILTLACPALAGWRQGAIRASISFVGILLAVLLAGLVGKLVHLLLPHMGVTNPITAWAVAPIVAFILINAAFKAAAQPLHHKVEHFYKYKAGDLRLALWERLNSRLGICVGVMNGALYFILISFLLYNVAYWTVQVSTDSKPSIFVRLVNNLGEDLQSSGLDRTACAVSTISPLYYQLADVSGMLMQNPKVGQRLADYPGLMSLWERDDMQTLVNDSTVTGAPAAGASLGTILENKNVVAFLKNKELTTLTKGILETNITDLTEYMKTGKSPKYAGQKIIGRWEFNPAVTFAWTRQNQPKMGRNEVLALRAWMFQAYAGTHLLAAGDHQVFLKHFPHLKPNPGQPPTTEYQDWKGDWSPSGTNYDLHLVLNGQDRFMTATAKDLRLTIKDGRNLMIFDRTD